MSTVIFAKHGIPLLWNRTKSFWAQIIATLPSGFLSYQGLKPNIPHPTSYHRQACPLLRIRNKSIGELSLNLLIHQKNLKQNICSLDGWETWLLRPAQYHSNFLLRTALERAPLPAVKSAIVSDLPRASLRHYQTICWEAFQQSLEFLGIFCKYHLSTAELVAIGDDFAEMVIFNLYHSQDRLASLAGVLGLTQTIVKGRCTRIVTSFLLKLSGVSSYFSSSSCGDFAGT